MKPRTITGFYQTLAGIFFITFCILFLIYIYKLTKSIISVLITCIILFILMYVIQIVIGSILFHLNKNNNTNKIIENVNTLTSEEVKYIIDNAHKMSPKQIKVAANRLYQYKLKIGIENAVNVDLFGIEPEFIELDARMVLKMMGEGE